MKKILLFTFLLLSGIYVRAQFNVQLNTETSVTFPVTAEQGNAENSAYWVARLTKDSTEIRMMAMVLDGRKFDLDAKTIAANYDKPEFIDALVGGMLGNRQGINVKSREKITKGKAKGYDIYMENETPDEDYPHTKIYTRFLFSGALVYMLGVYTTEGIDATAEKNHFFNSITIK